LVRTIFFSGFAEEALTSFAVEELIMLKTEI
jgi:hypothetical protein